MNKSIVTEFDQDIQVTVRYDIGKKIIVFYTSEDFPNLFGYTPTLLDDYYVVTERNLDRETYFASEKELTNGSNIILSYDISFKKKTVNSINQNLRSNFIRNSIRQLLML